MLASEGCGFDVVSGGELERVLRASRRSASRTVFSGVGKTEQEILHALKAQILLFNVESESELWKLAECSGRQRVRAPIALRVNPDVSADTHPYISTGLRQHKFGIPIEEARTLYARAGGTRHLRIAGVSVHIGSQITDVRSFAAAMHRVATVAELCEMAPSLLPDASAEACRSAALDLVRVAAVKGFIALHPREAARPAGGGEPRSLRSGSVVEAVACT